MRGWVVNATFRLLYPRKRDPVGTSKGGGKQWQPTPKKLPRMQCARAIPVAWLGSGSCQNRPDELFCVSFLMSRARAMWLPHLILRNFITQIKHQEYKSWNFPTWKFCYPFVTFCHFRPSVSFFTCWPTRYSQVFSREQTEQMSGAHREPPTTRI